MQITILALQDHYLPGFKAGGALRSLEYLVERLGKPLSFRVVTSDRDLGDTAPYPAAREGEWQRVGGATVLYLRRAAMTPGTLRRLIADTPHQVLYLNSLFSPRLSLLPLLLRRLGLLPRRPVVVAPRGSLHPGMLHAGSWGRWVPAAIDARLPSPRYLKKRLCLALCRALGMFEGVVWQASSRFEAADIRKAMGPRARVAVAPDVPTLPPAGPLPRRPAKQPGRLRLIYLSRIDVNKNLDGALELLAGLRGEVELDVYGPVKDRRYWARCQRAIDRLPGNVQVRVHGPVPHEAVGEIFHQHEFFLFPTRGENFGHVVLEALVQGCPVLISDRTPWRHLEELGVGWEIPLEQPAAMRDVLQRCIDMGAAEFAVWARRASEFGRAYSSDDTPVRLSRALFLEAAGVAPAAGDRAARERGGHAALAAMIPDAPAGHG